MTDFASDKKVKTEEVNPNEENTQKPTPPIPGNKEHIPNNSFGDSVNGKIISSSGRNDDSRFFYQTGKY